MSMLNLSKSPTFTILMGFWVAGSLVIFLITLLIFSFVLSNFAVIVIPFLALTMLAGAIYARPEIAQKPYRVYVQFNRRVIRLSRKWVSCVAFVCVVLSNRRYGRLNRFKGIDDTMWRVNDRAGGSVSKYEGEGVYIDGMYGEGWLLRLYGWIRETDSWWVIGLIPYIIVLHLLKEDDMNRKARVDTYTLY